MTNRELAAKIEIDTFTSKRGENEDATLHSLWFWVDGKCVHIGTFDTHFDAEWTGKKVMEAVDLMRHAIRKLI
jgi:hypothetical protein